MWISDDELIRKFSKGDLKAFELIVARYKDQLFNFIYRSLGDYHRAEDITQEVFFRIIKNVHKYKPEERFKSWIYKISANLCKNEIRDRQRRQSHIYEDFDQIHAHHESLILDSSLSPDEVYEKKQTRLAVQKAIDSLPELPRLSIILREYHNFSYSEIAYSLGCSVSGVKSMIYRARQILKGRLASDLRRV